MKRSRSGAPGTQPRLMSAPSTKPNQVKLRNR
jgi:hypothetical protein